LVLAMVTTAAVAAVVIAPVLGWSRCRAQGIEQSWAQQLDKLWDPLPVDEAGSKREPPSHPTVTALLSPVTGARRCQTGAAPASASPL
jgi:hypothetical protein